MNLYSVPEIVWVEKKYHNLQKDRRPYFASKSPWTYAIFESGDGFVLADLVGTIFPDELFTGTVSQCKGFAEKHKMKELKRFLNLEKK